jgi:hypothetical protein
MSEGEANRNEFFYRNFWFGSASPKRRKRMVGTRREEDAE